MMQPPSVGRLGDFDTVEEEVAAVARDVADPVSGKDRQTSRPNALSIRLAAIPDTLTALDQWVCWRYEYRGEWTKVPVDVDSGRFASSTDPETWTAFQDAVAYHDRGDTDTDGVGFVVHDDDMFVGIDLDDCRDPTTGEIDPWAFEIVEAVDSYTEVSPSGRGARMFVLAVLPEDGNRGDVDGAEGPLEMYETRRYLTVTGHHVDETPQDMIEPNDAVAEVHTEYIASEDDDHDAEKRPLKPNPDDVSTAESTAPGGNGLADDDVLDLARSAKNGEKFTRLFDRGDVSGYDTHSEGQQALANLLAFWTAGNEKQMFRLFRSSDLCRGVRRPPDLQKLRDTDSNQGHEQLLRPRPRRTRRRACRRPGPDRQRWKKRDLGSDDQTGVSGARCSR